jgi:bis(5'-adenosyl)-triphosphatase
MPLSTPSASKQIFFSTINVTSQVFHTTPLSFAFVNYKPLVPGHVLVSPRRVSMQLSDLTPAELTDLFSTVTRVQTTLRRVYGVKSFNVAVQDGPEAGQTVPHVHAHVLPRKGMAEDGGDRIYQQLEGHEGDLSGWISRGQTEQEAKALRDWLQRKDQKKDFVVVKDEMRLPRSDEEMNKEAEWLRDEMAKDDSKAAES